MNTNSKCCREMDRLWEEAHEVGDRFLKAKADEAWTTHRLVHRVRDERDRLEAEVARLTALCDKRTDAEALWHLQNPPPDPSDPANLIDWRHHWHPETLQQAVWNWFCDYGEWPQPQELWGRLAATEYSTLDYAREETGRALREGWIYGLPTVVAMRLGEVPGDWRGDLPPGDNSFRIAVEERFHAELRRQRAYDEDIHARMRRLAAQS